MKNTACGKKPMVVFRIIINSPIRVISKALDLYVKYMITNFATGYNSSLVIMETIPNSQQLRRRLNTSSDSDHLIRAISTTSTTTTSNSSVSTTTRLRVSRIGGGGIRTIDEDRAYSFRDDGIVTTKKFANKICFLVNSVRR